MTDRYDIAVIGAGPGGYVAALKAAQMGAKTAIIEKHHLGGTCLNYGCIPSKALLSSAELLHQVQNAATWGIKTGDASPDWPAIQKHKDKVLRQLRGGVGALLKGRKVDLYTGTATFTSPTQLSIADDKGKTQTIDANKVIVATGSSPIRIPGWPDDPKMVCTSDESVHWDTLPKELLIVGGGVIGCEFACMCQPMGVKVTIVELLPELLPGMDNDLGQSLHETFTKRGIDVRCDTKVQAMELAGKHVAVKLSSGETLKPDRVLVCIGRKPNTAGLGLENVGIETTKKGFVAVNDKLETNVPGVYAIGDVNGKCLLAHAASAHAVRAVENALGDSEPFDSPIPGAVYTFPEIGAVGMTEQQAADKNLPISVGRFPLAHLGKAMATRHTDGFIKVIRHRETDELLGVHMIGHNATEVIAAATAALHAKVSTHELANMAFAHPTISETIKESAEDALGMGLHLPPRKIVKLDAVMG